MRTTHLPAQVPGSALIHALAAAALSASALAGAALVLSLCAPAAAHAETATLAAGAATAAPKGFSLAATPPRRFGPGLVTPAEESAILFAWPTTTPPAPARSAIPQFRLEADDGSLSTVYHVRDYDLRLEAGTVFYNVAAVPGQPTNPQTLRGRLMSRVITRF